MRGEPPPRVIRAGNANMRGDLVPASRLPSTTVVELVQRRCEARASRNYAAADALKERLEAGGVKLQDCLGGGTTWEYSVSRRDGGGASPMTALARTALESHTDRAAVSRLSDEALALCAAGEPLLGRVAADAAFDFALAGCESAPLLESLAAAQAAEFDRWRRPQPLVSLQVCERLAAAGLGGAAFARAAAALERGGAAHAAAAASLRGLSFGSPRPLRWLWRRAAALPKEAPPRDADADAALALALGGFDDPRLPLVLDLGCGCDSSALKTAFATGTASRWGTAATARFASASAERCLAAAASSSTSRLAGVLVQFPTPYRAPGGGNAQLPTREEGYMLWRVETTPAIHSTSPRGGSSMRSEKHPFSRRIPPCEKARRGLYSPGLRAHGGGGGGGGGEGSSLRRARVARAGGGVGAADGPGWLRDNPLGVLSETEAALLLDGRRVHRFLARARGRG
ncbi:hypothetical protein EMIHUDRAFT_118746 [Emiliania huxleyi CCMP1516]|uniref:Uncharacterized protein n=2 Tax=Emiliania huxleyi TaxID=2903 RepID=A0A0D3J0N1_EMIH1|nr:hypothetical protein EMIHUDRAFT_118746 [Emiliania huxleyi CCMP1516]EOD17066.1 hypothetical protein EMIHUDRAFT_118746 [Emiliania huxleyi CCMP1516]|eukprot:XP_005769495.1 hypothetical protein EMIHUDRAFT_118746 [Emiliania huxleyi CCMP1516]